MWGWGGTERAKERRIKHLYILYEGRKEPVSAPPTYPQNLRCAHRLGSSESTSPRVFL